VTKADAIDIIFDLDSLGVK